MRCAAVHGAQSHSLRLTGAPSAPASTHIHLHLHLTDGIDRARALLLRSFARARARVSSTVFLRAVRIARAESNRYRGTGGPSPTSTPTPPPAPIDVLESCKQSGHARRSVVVQTYIDSAARYSLFYIHPSKHPLTERATIRPRIDDVGIPGNLNHTGRDILSGTNCQAPAPKTDASSSSLVVVSLRAVRARGRVRRDALLGPHVALPVLGDAARLRLEVRDGRRALAVRGRPQRVPRVREEVERRGVRHDLQMRVRGVCVSVCVCQREERKGEEREGKERKGKEMRRDRGAGRCGWRVWEEGKAWREGGEGEEGRGRMGAHRASEAWRDRDEMWRWSADADGTDRDVLPDGGRGEGHGDRCI